MVQTETIMTYYSKKTETPVGELKLIASERGLAAVLWQGDDPTRVQLEPQVEDEDNDVGTEFQTSVWRALLKIPFGQTRTYTQIAKQIGRPTAARAVGAASGKNPISIMAPCHRVVGANGDLTGFAGGLETKELLLALERDGGLRLGRAH
jgi:methylated-DNA-[protein]-cysteine S-methyltransferase